MSPTGLHIPVNMWSPNVPIDMPRSAGQGKPQQTLHPSVSKWASYVPIYKCVCGLEICCQFPAICRWQPNHCDKGQTKAAPAMMAGDQHIL